MSEIATGPDPAAVGRRLEALRLALGIDEQKDFAAAIRVDPSSYTKIKDGSKPLRLDMGYRVAIRFGVTMDYIYRGDLSQLPDNIRQKIIAYLGGQKA